MAQYCCNAGHFNVEICIPDLEELEAAKSEKKTRKNITCYELNNGKKLYLLGEGRLVNLACGDGHPAEIMDLEFFCNLRLMPRCYTESPFRNFQARRF